MRATSLATLIFALILVASPLHAKEPSIFVELNFDPQEAVESYRPESIDLIRGASFALSVRDGRSAEDLTSIGQGTTARDREFAIRIAGESTPFIEDGLRKSAADWGLIIDSGSALKLDAALHSVDVVEDGQWVGSKYKGRIEIAFEMRDAQDNVVWMGRAAGEANRFGRKQNVKNINEVLSDALKQAFTALMDTAAVRNALIGDVKNGR